MTFWPECVLLMALVFAIALSRISPCVCCDVADEGNTSGEQDCQKDCAAFLAYKKRLGRRN